MPYIANRENVPERTRLLNRIFYWTVMVIGVVSAIWTFFFKDEKQVYVGLQFVYFFLTFMSAIFMVIALWRIRRFLKERGLGDRLSPLRMLVHALAFWLYIFVYFGITIATELAGPNSNYLYYVKWVVVLIVAFLSYICLFFVMWHLGSKDTREEFSDFKSETTGITTLLGDNFLQV